MAWYGIMMATPKCPLRMSGKLSKLQPKNRFMPYEPRRHPKSAQPQPLLVYYDCETTGLDTYNDRIIEIGATIDSSEEMYISEPKNFERLIFTTRASHPKAFSTHGITRKELDGKKPFPEVLQQFCTWLTSKCEEISRASGIPYYAVLVAHNGYAFDYKILASEMKRHKIDVSCFDGIRFSDSLQHLRQMKQHSSILNDIPKLALQSLCKVYFPPEKDYKGHRALKDAENLKWLFTNTPLKTLLPFTYKELL